MFRCAGFQVTDHFCRALWQRLQFVRFDTLTFAVHDDPLAALLKMPVLVGVKALPTFENSRNLE